MKFRSEAWVLKKREEQRFEATQIKFLRHLLGITKLDKDKNQYIRGKNGNTEHTKGNERVPEKSGYNTYRGWTQTEYKNKYYNIDQKTKEHRTTEEEMEEPTSFRGLRNRKHA